MTPGLFVNVTDLIAETVDMLGRHRSPKVWLDESQGLGSYLEKMKELGEQVGAMTGRDDIRYAEGFRKHLHLGFCDPDDDPLFDALGGYVMTAVECEADQD